MSDTNRAHRSEQSRCVDGSLDGQKKEEEEKNEETGQCSLFEKSMACKSSLSNLASLFLPNLVSQSVSSQYILSNDEQLLRSLNLVLHRLSALINSKRARKKALQSIRWMDRDEASSQTRGKNGLTGRSVSQSVGTLTHSLQLKVNLTG